jgi:hypothetical protein
VRETAVEHEAAMDEFTREHHCRASDVSPRFWKCFDPTPTYWIEIPSHEPAN